MATRRPPARSDTPERVHADVDRVAGALADRHRGRLQCRRGCHACCVDDIAVLDVEAERIRAERPEVLSEAPHPTGACAFLDAEGACRIYEQRPYVCRTQGLPLRWFDRDAESGATAEYRDICPLNETAEPLDALRDEDCWLLGPVEERLQSLSPDGHRILLRDLFRGES
jgi:Fe-S-cluster containining protein